MKWFIHSDFSNHILCVRDIPEEKLPTNIVIARTVFTKFYEVRNFDKKGVVFMYLGKGYKSAPKQIVAWYPKGGFWSSYGKTFKEAIEGAQRDGWLYA